MKCLFVELPAFSRIIRSGKMTDDILRNLQDDIMKGLGDIIPGTRGIKKIRCAREGSGKRGGWRVIYADYPIRKIVVLITAFPKNLKENLTQEEIGELKIFKGFLDKEMETRHG